MLKDRNMIITFTIFEKWTKPRLMFKLLDDKRKNQVIESRRPKSVQVQIRRSHLKKNQLKFEKINTNLLKRPNTQKLKSNNTEKQTS